MFEVKLTEEEIRSLCTACICAASEDFGDDDTNTDAYNYYRELREKLESVLIA